MACTQLLSSGAMHQLNRLPSPLKARAIGVVYLLYFVVALLSLVVFKQALEWVSVAIYVVVTLLFYILLRPVSHGLALLATALSLVGQALAVFFHAIAAGLVCDGLFLIVLGFLIVRSTFLPRPLGILIVLAGLAWLTFAVPSLSGRIHTYVEALGFVAEVALMIWLLVAGVDLARWRQQQRAPSAASKISTSP